MSENIFPQTCPYCIILPILKLAFFREKSHFCFSFTCQLFLGLVQCLVFLGFLPLLENFELATPIPVGIRVLGVDTPLRT